MAEADQSPPSTVTEPLADGDGWMTTAEVATEWGRNVETVRRWIREGQLPAHRTPGGRTLLVKRSDVLNTLERGRIEVEQRRAPAGDSQMLDVPGDRTMLIG
ncbi:MAG: helix-turn-helix domain-containing protein [Solirubrobacteraceae bacterium]